jgi:peptide methionine sulfoxide reductase msrA/msrB
MLNKRRWGFIILGVIVVVLGIIMMFDMSKSENSENADPEELEEIYVAGGCFWCIESDFEKLQGVQAAVSGYAGGHGENPTYEDYSSKGHIEAVKIIYDSKKISREKLVAHFWTHIDPLDGEGQFCDRGHAYISALLYRDKDEKELFEKSKEKVADILGKEIKTELIEYDKFFEAEAYHQDYHKKHSIQYKFYRNGCGRDKRVQEVWGGKDLSLSDSKYSDFVKPSDEELKKQLTDIQYHVTQEEGTEKPFDNEYYANKEEGIYVDIVSGEPLFSSTDKFDSGTGWPSFLKPIDKDFVVERDDYKLLTRRTEIRSKYADSHLGHIILDGPESNDKIRYCMNSAALKFIPKEEIKKSGYEEYLYLFEK